MIQKGTKIEYDWWNGTVTWTVQETYTEKVTKTLKWSEVTRDGQAWNKALYIETDDGDMVLKSENEVRKC